MGNSVKRCQLGLFQDASFAGDLQDSKSKSGRMLCIWCSHTFVLLSCMCKKQTAVSPSSAESEIISLEAGLRKDVLATLQFWDRVVESLTNSSAWSKPEHQRSDTPRVVRTRVNNRQYCCVGNTAQHCILGLLQDSDDAGDLEDSKSTSGGILCIFGSHTSVPISWLCKKQTSVSHSSTEAERMSLDAGSRMDGIPALDLWDLVIEVFHSLPNQTNNTKGLDVHGNLSATPQPNMRKQIPTTNTYL